jgi:hypothetical protein
MFSSSSAPWDLQPVVHQQATFRRGGQVGHGREATPAATANVTATERNSPCSTGATGTSARGRRPGITLLAAAACATPPWPAAASHCPDQQRCNAQIWAEGPKIRAPRPSRPRGLTGLGAPAMPRRHARAEDRGATTPAAKLCRASTPA